MEFESAECREQICNRRVVAEGLADMRVAIDVAWRKDKTAPELKWIFAQLVLTIASGFRPLARSGIVFTQKVEQGSFVQSGSLVSFAFIVDEQREFDSRIVTKQPGIVGVAETNGDQLRAFLRKFFLMFAQLRNMLSAKDSTVVTKKDHNRRRPGPQ